MVLRTVTRLLGGQRQGSFITTYEVFRCFGRTASYDRPCPEKSGTPDPTEAELTILQVLWHKGPSSVREVWEEVGKKTGYTTVLKFLQIMLEKNLVRRNEGEMTHIYEAAVAKEKTQERLVHGLMNRAFSGSASQLVLRALSGKSISPEELRDIRAFLAEEERKRQ